MKDSKITWRQHYEAVARSGVPVPELENEPELPQCLEYLWGFYQELGLGRQSSGYGPQPIGYSEMKAWQDLKQVVLEPWEVVAIKDIDMTYLVAMSEKA